MENRIDILLNKIKDLKGDSNLDDDACAFVNLEDINDISLFNVAEIDLTILNLNFNNWMNVEDNHIDDDNYISTFPQVKIKYIENNLYEITFDFYGFDELIGSVSFKLSTVSLKIILTNLLNHQISIRNIMLNNI